MKKTKRRTLTAGELAQKAALSEKLESQRVHGPEPIISEEKLAKLMTGEKCAISAREVSARFKVGLNAAYRALTRLELKGAKSRFERRGSRGVYTKLYYVEG